MINFTTACQIIVAFSVAYVWIFRFHNIILEFKQFGLSDVTRSAVGATKIALATLLIAGIWYPALVLVPSLLMGLMMVAAQFFHFKIRNPLVKHLPSLILLLLCVFIALASSNILKL